MQESSEIESEIKPEPCDSQRRKLSEAQTSSQTQARSLGYQSQSGSPTNLWHGVRWPHEIQISDLRPGNLVLSTGLLVTHRSKANRKITLDCICVSLLCLELTGRCQELEESWPVPHLSLPQFKFSERQKGHLCSGTGKGGALEQGGKREEASMGNCGQGPYKNKKSVSRNRRCQLESAHPKVWREEMPKRLFCYEWLFSRPEEKQGQTLGGPLLYPWLSLREPSPTLFHAQSRPPRPPPPEDHHQDLMFRQVGHTIVQLPYLY